MTPKDAADHGVVDTSTPGYYEAIENAKAGVGRYVPLEEALAAERARRARRDADGPVTTKGSDPQGEIQ